MISDPAGDRFYRLNGTAQEICLLCDGSRRLDDITRSLTDAYDGTLEISRTNTATTIEELRQAGIMTSTEGDPS